MAAALIAIAGPTAVGKSAVALSLAASLQGEIISVDSMQVYRGMDIGTAKPSMNERRGVPHHLIDILNISQGFDAAQFVRAAEEAVQGIRKRGKTSILCGGTGLYFKAFFEGLGTAPPANAEVRAQLEHTPIKELLDELERADPATFARIDKSNPRRVIRALEVIRLTGRPFSEQKASWKESEHSNALFVVLTRPAELLRRRIDARVDQMFQAGLVEETRRLLGCGLQENRTALQALGYRQVCDHLLGGVPLEETIELVKVRTRQFAKRQMTWFRRQSGVSHWLELAEDETAEATADRIRALVS
jgi:tRNA dimethylallyltransferase